MTAYVHGYSKREAERLSDQAQAVESLLHDDTHYPAGCRILEAGCGIGAQTRILAQRSPDAHFVSIDRSPSSLAAAGQAIAECGFANVSFQQADIYRLPFEDAAFDHVFVCFVLEHLPDPAAALVELIRVLRPGGTLTSIEGDHGSCYFHPQTPLAQQAWQCLIDCQQHLGGDPLIGRRLYPLLTHAGLRDVCVSPRMVYADRSRPQVQDSFVGRTIVPMVAGVAEQVATRRLMTGAQWEQGLADLRHTGQSPDGVFCYTFFKALGVKA